MPSALAKRMPQDGSVFTLKTPGHLRPTGGDDVVISKSHLAQRPRMCESRKNGFNISQVFDEQLKPAVSGGVLAGVAAPAERLGKQRRQVLTTDGLHVCSKQLLQCLHNRR